MISARVTQIVTVIAVLIASTMPLWKQMHGDMLFVLVASLAAVVTGMHAVQARSYGSAALALAWMLGAGIRVPYIASIIGTVAATW